MTSPSLPPVPDSVHERYLLAWHPGDDAAWLVTNTGSVWRVARDGSGERIADQGAAGDSTDLHEILYFDPARKAMVHVSLPGSDEPLQVCAWDGEGFAPVEQIAGAGPARERDGVVFDARRGVLVHLRLGEAEGAPLTVAELGTDGRWRATGASLPFASDRVIAGWDPSRGRVVVLDGSTGQTHAWDGAAFERLGDFPASPSGWPWTTFPAAKTGHLMLLRYAPFSSPEGLLLDGSELWELTGSTWTARDAGTLEVFGGAVHDPVRDVSLVFGPWFGPGTQQRTLAILDGERLVGAGLPVYEISGGSVAGPVRFWGKRDPGQDSSDRLVTRLYASQVMLERVDGALVLRPSSPTATEVIVSAGAGSMALTDEGALFRLDDAGWREVAAASDAYGRRRSVCAGGDSRGRVLVVGGENDYTRKHVTTGFLFDGKAWRSLPDKGIPVVTRAHVVADEAKDAWLLVGAHDRKGKDDFKVHELADGKWTSHASTLKAHVLSIALLAWDEASEQVFVVATLFDAEYDSKTSLFVYRGAGRWDACGAVEVGGQSTAHDAARRAVVSVNAPELSELEIGPMLDAAAQGQAPAKAAAGKKVAKKVAKKKVAPPQTAHLIRFIKKGVDHYGGLPRGVSAELWPLCESCGAAMQHVLALGAHDPRLPLQKHAGLAVFVCNSGKGCATWDPDSGCNKVLLLSEEQREQKALAEPPRARGGPKPSPVVERLAIGYKTRVEHSPETEDVEPTEAASKVGGFPVWVQSPQVPECSKCAKPMRFIAQLMEETAEVNFGGGDGYVFCCAKEHQAKFLWQQ